MESIKEIFSHALTTGNVLAPDELKEKRLAICNACKYYSGDRCGKCGCFMNIKASLTATRCPLDIWGAKLVEEALMGDLYYNTIDEHLYKEDCCG